MSSLGGGGQGLASLARVAFESTGVGEVSRDIERVEQVYRSSAGEMSDSAIKVQLAQERLQRSLKKGPAAFQSQANAELALRRAERELRGETDLTTRSLDRQQRELGQASRGALLGTGAFRSLGRSVAFASAGFLGGAGLVYGMRAAISVASNLEEQMSKTRQVFNESAQGVIDWSTTTSTSMGIARDQALASVSTYGLLFRNIGQGAKPAAELSQALVQLAADMASFNNTSVDDALNAIRSGLTGEIEPLRRYGVFLSEARARTQALADTQKKSATELTTGEKVLARYKLLLQDTARTQGDYARTADGLANSQRTLSALWRDAQGLVGQALAPAYTDAVQAARDWLAVDKNRLELQKQVNTVVQDGVAVGRRFVTVAEQIADRVGLVSKAFGGVGNAIETALIIGIVLKARKAAVSLGLITASSAVMRTKMIADAAAIGAALDVATRPRNVFITTTGGGTPGAPGVPGTPGIPGARPLGRPSLRDRIGQYGNKPTPGPRATPGVGGLAVVGFLASILGAEFLGSGDEGSIISTSDYGALKRAASDGRLGFPGVSELRDRGIITKRQAAVLRALIRGRAVTSDAELPGDRAEGAANLPPGGRGGGGRGTGTGNRRTLADIELDIARPGNEVGDLQEKRGFIQRQVRQLEALSARKKLTDEQKAKLASLYGDLASTQSQLDAIADEGEQKIEDQRTAAAEKRQAAREKAQARAEAVERREEAARERDARRMGEIRESAAKRAEARADLFAKGGLGQANTRAELRRAALRGVNATVKGLKDDGGDDKGLTAAQVHAMQFEFLSKLTGEIGQYGSNFESDSGQIATQSHVQTSLLRDQNAALHRLVEGAWHPGAQLASADLSAAGWGVGF